MFKDEFFLFTYLDQLHTSTAIEATKHPQTSNKMATMKAVIVESHSEPIRLKDVAIPTPTNGEVVVKVLVLYLLPYTKSIIDGSLGYPVPLPFTPGGSCIGRVHAVGVDSTVFKDGQLVFCDPTIQARDDATAQFLMGINEGVTDGSRHLMREVYRYGSLADFVKMPLENVHLLDEEALLGPDGFALTDLPQLQACMIPFGGLSAAGVKVGDTVIVAPATGKFGGSAVMVALAMGARVVALGRSEDNLARLKKSFPHPGLLTVKVGGNETGDTEAIMKVLKGKAADAYIDFTPGAAAAGGKTPTHIATCIHALKRGGTAILMGGIFGNIEIPYMEILFKNISVKGNFMYGRDHVQQLLKMAETGHFKLLKSAGLKTIAFKLDQIEEALEVASQNPGWSTNIAVTP